jgi:hypothetical protein
LLSLGMVADSGEEHYVELDLNDPTSAETLARASDFARQNGVLEQWGRVPDSAASRAVMGERTARWLQEQAARLGHPATIAFDYAPDFELLERLLRDAAQWDSVREVVRLVGVNYPGRPTTTILAGARRGSFGCR